jgi:HlyD family secretion protein
MGVLVVGGLLAVALWPRAIPVEVATVSRGPLVVTIDEEGQTRVRDRFVVTSPVSGELLRVALQPGDQVVKGKTRLATVRAAAPVPLDARTRAEAGAAVQSAEAAEGRLSADLARATTALSLARSQYSRTKALEAGGAVPREQVEASEADLHTAEAAVEAARFAVTQARHDVQAARARLTPTVPDRDGRDVVILAPIDGVVLARHHESESVVPAGEPLIDLGDPGRLEIVADVLSADAVKIRPGGDVLIDQWGGAETLHGRVRLVEPSGFTKVSALGVEEQRVNVIVDFEPPVDVATSLGDNFRVEVRIVVWQSDSVVQVSPGSLFRRGDDWAVYVVEDGRARLRTVRIGQRTSQAVQVVSGLDEGATVVLYPPDTLVDGSRVTARQPA